MRNADSAHNQPITNIAGTDKGNPQCEGWSSPVVINMMVDGVLTPRVFLGIGEGENPDLFSFIYCLDGNTGDVIWIYCTCQFVEGQPNPVNQLPADVLKGDVPPGFTVFNGTEVTRGCSIWAAIAYDEDTGLLYATTGQPAVPSDAGKPAGQGIDKGLPSVGWSSGILALNAVTGEYHAFQQMPPETSYRDKDFDVDIGSAATVYTVPATSPIANNAGTAQASPRKVVSVGCKNGGFYGMRCTYTGLDSFCGSSSKNE